jgi:hypothetical protein
MRCARLTGAKQDDVGSQNSGFEGEGEDFADSTCDHDGRGDKVDDATAAARKVRIIQEKQRHP